MTPSLDTPAHVVRKQTVTIEVDLIAVGEQDAEAVEIRVNGKAMRLNREMAASSWYRHFASTAEQTVERVALWAAKPGDWEIEG